MKYLASSYTCKPCILTSLYNYMVAIKLSSLHVAIIPSTCTGVNITSVAIIATAGGNIISVAISATARWQYHFCGFLMTPVFRWQYHRPYNTSTVGYFRYCMWVQYRHPLTTVPTVPTVPI